MNDSFNYLYPVFALVLLTFIVTGKMLLDRIGEMKARKLRLRTFATSKDREQLENIQAADNFKNLIELPVLFYLLCALLLHFNIYRPVYFYLLWVYVIARYIHSYIHCTYNKVLHRFYVFLVSFLVLISLWVIFFFEVLTLGNHHL